MENQHRQIKGYKELTQDDINLMNEVKQKGAELGAIIEKLDNIPEIDKNWLVTGKLGVQQGLMAITRAITRPDFF